VTAEASTAHHRHAVVMRRLEELLEANPDRTLYLAELCAATGASDRTLRACCQEHLGMSPMRYLWLRRMHLARRALRVADPSCSNRDGDRDELWLLGIRALLCGRIGRCSGNHPRQRCAGHRTTSDRKKYRFALAAS